MKIYFFKEGSDGFYSNIIFDTEEGKIIEMTEKSVSALDYHTYGLQGIIEVLQGNKKDCFKELHEKLTEKAKQLNLNNILISLDQNGKYDGVPLWKLSTRYQFMIKKK